jgi:hypothetical protein
MRVIAHVLSSIDDDRLMFDQMENSSAIAELVQDYNRLADYSCDDTDPDQHLYIVGRETYGRDLKQWISFLPAPERWHLMDRFLSNITTRARERALEAVAAPTPHKRRSPWDRREENEAETDKRQLRHFAIRMVLIALFMFMVLVLAAGVTIMQKNHLLPDNVVLTAILQTAVEVAKILFTFK